MKGRLILGGITIAILVGLCGCNKKARIVSEESGSGNVQAEDSFIYPDENTVEMSTKNSSNIREADEATQQADKSQETNFPSMTTEEWMAMYEKSKLCKVSIVNPFEVSVEGEDILCNGKRFAGAGVIAGKCSAQALKDAGNAMWLVGENLGDEVGAIVSVNLTEEEKAEGFDADAQDVIEELRDGVSNADDIQNEYGTLEFSVNLVNGDEVGSTQVVGTANDVFIIGDGEPIVIDMQKKQIMLQKDYDAQGESSETAE